MSVHAVRVRILPPPRTLVESRAVLKALQRFGPLSSFISLRYFEAAKSPNVVLAIFEGQSAAKQALASSPLYVQNPRDKATVDGSGPTMRCEISRSDIDHRHNARMNPLNGPFLIDYSSLPYDDLRRNGAPRQVADCSIRPQQRLSSKEREDLLKEVQLPAGGLMGLYQRGRAVQSSRKRVHASPNPEILEETKSKP